MQLITSPQYSAALSLPEVFLCISRQKLARRLWRAAADDGVEFGFDLSRPLRDGDEFWSDGKVRYVIQQEPEPVLIVSLKLSVEAAAAIGWAVGNLHFQIETQEGRLLTPDDSALRQTFDRLGIVYQTAVERFHPHQYASSVSGHSHSHGSGCASGEVGDSYVYSSRKVDIPAIGFHEAINERISKRS